MNDADIKRYFPFVVLAMLAVIAYLQVSACGDLIAARLAQHAEPTVAPPATASAELDDGAPILERNAFDSETGPLDAGVVEGDDAGPPACTIGRVVMIAASEDPAWSFATIVDRQGHSQLRRVGDDIDGFRVEAVEWDRVLLRRGDASCQLLVGEAGATALPGGRDKPRPPTALLLELADSMRKAGNEIHLPRALASQLLAAQEELTAEVRMKPQARGDKIVGLRLEGIKKGTLFDWLGLQNGDVLQSVNGQALADPDKAPDIYALLGTADQLTVRLERRGVPVTMTYVIE